MTHAMCPGYVLTQTIPGATHTFALPEEHNANFRKVVAVGGALTTDFDALVPPPCQAGQTICIASDYIKFQDQGEEYQVVKFQEVLSIVEDYGNPR